METTTVRLAAATMMLFALACAKADDDKSPPKKKETQREVVSRHQSEQQKLISDLVLTINTANLKEVHGDDELSEAIEMLGFLRAKEGARPICNVIDYTYISTPKVRRNGGITVKALVRIGKPASLEAVERLATEKSEERIEMFVMVITGVEGVDLGREMMKLAISKETDPEKKKRLKAALELFKSEK
jgi:hypothetical protein